jgi:hypothetical protein
VFTAAIAAALTYGGANPDQPIDFFNPVGGYWSFGLRKALAARQFKAPIMVRAGNHAIDNFGLTEWSIFVGARCINREERSLVAIDRNVAAMGSESAGTPCLNQAARRYCYETV